MPYHRLQVEHFGALGSQRVDKVVVVLLCLLRPQHVVEEQAVLVARRQAIHLAAGPMNDDLTEATDFRSDPIHGTFLPVHDSTAIMLVLEIPNYYGL